MPITGLSYVTLTGTFLNLHTALPSTGQLRFTMPFQIVNTTTNNIVVPGDFAAVLDSNGQFSISLPCTDDPDFLPIDRYWQVTEAVDGRTRTYAIQLPASPTTQDLADIAPIDPISPLAVYTIGGGGPGFVPSPGASADFGAALQTAFDAHYVVDLDPGALYYLDTPVFLDDPTNDARYILNCNGARIQLGPNLPHPTTWVTSIGSSPPTAFFNGTLRSAWNGVANSAVTTDSTSGTSNATFHPRLIIRDGVFNSNLATPCQLVFGGTCTNNVNGSAARLENLVLNDFLAGMSWSGYADGNSAVNCEIGSTHNVPGRLFYQRASGDGSEINNCKAYDPLTFIADVSGAHDVHITNCVGGRNIIAASTFTITAGHTEATEGSSAAPNSFNYDRSVGTVNEMYTWDSYISTKHSHLINDTTGPAYTGTRITFNRARPVGSYAGAAGDPAMGSSFHIAALNTGGQVVWRDCARLIRRAGGTASLTGLWATSADSSIQSAISAAGDSFASGNAVLSYVNGWVVEPGNGTLPDTRTIAAPSFTVANDSVISGGSLVNGTTYYYVIACVTQAGGYSALSSTQSVAANANGITNLVITNPSGPCNIIVWRKSSAAVTTAPDHYVVIGLPVYQTLWMDTGVNINGVPWITTSIPVPNTVASTGTQTLAYGRP